MNNKEPAGPRLPGAYASDELIAPHGGALVQSLLTSDEREALAADLARLPGIDISDAVVDDIEMIAVGAHSPLQGFMGPDVYKSVCDDMCLPDGLAWSLPVVLGVDESTARRLNVGGKAVLRHGDQAVGLITVEEIYPWDPIREARAVYGTDMPDHRPFLERASQANYLIGGPIRMLALPAGQRHRWRWPTELRRTFTSRGWSRVSALSLARPWTRADEYTLRAALESADALVLWTAAGARSDAGELPHEAFAQASRQLLSDYFPRDRIVPMPLPAGIPLHGERAALQQAILSQNFGCAGIVFPEPAPTMAYSNNTLRGMLAHARRGALAIQPAFFAHGFHCETCGFVVSEKSCPHDPAQRVEVPSDEVTRQLNAGEALSPVIARPDIARALARAVSERSRPTAPTGRNIYPHAPEVTRELRASVAGHRPCLLWMTGLSGSGKSTIAHRLERELLLSGHRAFVLDGDSMRHGLSSDLGFDDAARRENLRRAGHVVKFLLDAGLIVIASFISPFRAERQMIRDLIGRDFHEVYVEAPLEVCERRDPKGLYKRARAGQIPQFTGISSPYEPPEAPEVRLDSSRASLDECVRELLRVLSNAGALRIHAKGQGLLSGIDVTPALAARVVQ